MCSFDTHFVRSFILHACYESLSQVPLITAPLHCESLSWAEICAQHHFVTICAAVIRHRLDLADQQSERCWRKDLTFLLFYSFQESTQELIFRLWCIYIRQKREDNMRIESTWLMYSRVRRMQRHVSIRPIQWTAVGWDYEQCLI